MRFVFCVWFLLLLAGCGVKTDLVTYEAWQADLEKSAREKEAAEKAQAEAALKAQLEATAPPAAPAAKKKRKKPQ